MFQATLYIVATPIGNLGDMVPRAVEVLQSVALIAAEDTRHSRRLLSHFSIDVPLVPYHDHSREHNIEKIERHLAAGDSVALISDAGTPLIADPGYRIVSRARALGYRVEPIPGPCALIAALSASGLPSDRFCFEGFLPAKSAARESTLSSLAYETRTLIFYEAPHRLLDALKAMALTWADRQAVIAREITKTFETFLSGTVSELVSIVEQDANQQRGEIVIMVRGYHNDKATAVIDAKAEHTMNILLAEFPVKKAAALAAEITGLKKRDLYQWAIERSDGC